MRLRQLERDLDVPVKRIHRAFILLEEPGTRHFTEYYLRHRRAARELTGLPYDLPAVGASYPSHSLPALEAAAWVQRRHPERFEELDLALYEAFFRDTRDISDPDVLAGMADRRGMDGSALRAALLAGECREVVGKEFHEALQRGVHSIPTAFIGGRALSGAVPYEEYEQAAREALRGE